MKVASLYLAICCLAATTVTGQMDRNKVRGEFADNTPNGLMYSDLDMRLLRHTVDSLNLQFKTCSPKLMYSCPQASIYLVKFTSKTDDLRGIMTDMAHDMPYAQLMAKYGRYLKKADSSQLFIQLDTAGFLQGHPGEGYDDVYMEKTSFKYSRGRKHSWQYNYEPKDQYQSHYSVTGRFFREDLQQKALPPKYAQLVQYVDCMIDTSSTVYLTTNIWGDEPADTKDLPAMLALDQYIKGKMNLKPGAKKELLEKAVADHAEKYLLQDSLFRHFLAKAIEAYAANKRYNSVLESLANSANMPNMVLLMKRCHRVVGMCSQDQGPRLHAKDIAITAAKAHSWDIFLRSHLDIMNDRFPRAIDGSYAYNQRKTYLKELEELNLNVVNLMLGLTLRAHNLAPNHYYGTIWRLGWALTESREQQRFEQEALQLVKDNELDEFNRGLVFLLYKTYLQRLENKQEAASKIKALQEQSASFPVFVQPAIKQLKVEEE